MATVNVTLTRAVRLPEVTAAGTTLDIEESLAYELKTRGDCVINTPSRTAQEPKPVMATTTLTGGMGFSLGSKQLNLLGGAYRPTILCAGDSFMQQGWAFNSPKSFTNVGSIAGIVSIVGLERNSVAGTGTLTFNAAAQTLQWTDTAGGVGNPVPLKGGYQIVPGGGFKTGVGLNITKSVMQTNNGSISITDTGSRGDELLQGVAIAEWLCIYSGQGYDIINQAASGSTLKEIPDQISRVDPDKYPVDGFMLNAGVNDINYGRSLESIKVDFITALDTLYERAQVGTVYSVSYFRPGWTATHREKARQLNDFIATVLKGYPGVVMLTSINRIAGADGVTYNSAKSYDGLHPSDSLAQWMGYDAWQYFRYALPPVPVDFGTGLDVWSATNPSGNRLPNPNLAGNSSGCATGWSYAATANFTGSASKVSRPASDGWPGEYQRITGAAAADNVTGTITAFSGAFVSGANVVAPGDVVQAFAEISCSAGQYAPGFRLAANTDGTIKTYSAFRQNSLNGPCDIAVTGVVATPSYVVKSGENNIQLLLQQNLPNGVSGATSDFGRVFCGYPKISKLTII